MASDLPKGFFGDKALIASANLDTHLTKTIQELRMPPPPTVPRRVTPSVIEKLHDRAQRARALLVETEVTAEKSDQILDSYEGSLRLYQSGLAQVKHNDDVLRTMIKDMGNYAGDIGDTFRQNAGTPPPDPETKPEPPPTDPPPPPPVEPPARPVDEQAPPQPETADAGGAPKS